MNKSLSNPNFFNDMCETIKKNPYNEFIWRAIFKDYLDYYICLVIYKNSMVTGKRVKEFLATVI